eukprot:7068086-Alexandrium_andersonii.AAC.1
MAQREETHGGAPQRARRPERPRRQEQGSHCKQPRADRRIAQGARTRSQRRVNCAGRVELEGNSPGSQRSLQACR